MDRHTYNTVVGFYLATQLQAFLPSLSMISTVALDGVPTVTVGVLSPIRTMKLSTHSNRSSSNVVMLKHTIRDDSAVGWKVTFCGGDEKSEPSTV